MAAKMRAAVLHKFGEPLLIEEVNLPVATEDEVLIRVFSTGLCGTDLKIMSGSIAVKGLPLIPGHEIAGEVVDDSKQFRAGQRVACYKDDPCGECDHCLRGQETLCAQSRRLGFEKDGGLAEYVVVSARNVLPFSSSVSFDVAAVCMDAVVSPWRALNNRARLQAGESIVIAGAGGLGINAVQIARLIGARVAVLEPLETHRRSAIEFGAELAVDPSQTSLVREWAVGGVDVGFDAAGNRAAFDALLACLGPGGRLVSCGYRPGVDYCIDSANLVLSEITVLGSRAGGRDEATACLRAVESGAISPPISRSLSLDEVNAGIQLLRDGGALGRVIIRPLIAT